MKFLKFVAIAFLMFLIGNNELSAQSSFQRIYGNLDTIAGNEGYYLSKSYRNGFILMGMSADSFYLQELNSIGDTLWTRYYSMVTYSWIPSTHFQDRWGNIYACFYNSDNEAACYVKFNSIGDIIWANNLYGSVGRAQAYMVFPEDDLFHYRIWWSNDEMCSDAQHIAKVDSSGTNVWQGDISPNSGNENIASTALLSDSSVVGVSYRIFNCYDENVTSSPVITRYLKDGTKAWSVIGNFSVSTVTATLDGGFLVGTDKFDTTGTQQGSFGITGEMIKQTADSGFVSAGVGINPNSNNPDIFLSKWNKFGTLEWTNYYGYCGNESFRNLIVTDDGGFAICGTSYPPTGNDSRIIVIKTDSAGNVNNQSQTGWGGLPITVTTGPITGPSAVCTNSTIVYSVPPVPNAVSYNWNLPAGIVGTSTGNSITVSINGSFNGGAISVTPLGYCNQGQQSSINLSATSIRPATPSAINGSTYLCGPGIYTFTTNSVNDATGYAWSISGNGASIIGPADGLSIQVQVTAGFGQGTISVRAKNCLGTSSSRRIRIVGLAVHSSPLTGPIYVCPNSTGITYSITPVFGATGYSWSITGNASITAQNNNSCVINFASTWRSGSLTVTTSSPCGNYSRTYILQSLPGQPNRIVGPSTNLCLADGINSANFSISPVNGATSYTWTAPPGILINSNSGTSISTTISPSFTQGNLCVKAANSCGLGSPRCSYITSKPAIPTLLSGPTNVCQSQTSVNYTLSPVNGITNYIWSISSGATITNTGNTATVNFSSAISPSSTLTSNAINSCGLSAPFKRTIAIDLTCKSSNPTQAALLQVYPNPASDYVQIQFLNDEDKERTIILMDALGRTIYTDTHKVLEAGLNNYNLELRTLGLAPGLYYVKVEGNRSALISRIVKQ